jgi:hypothetical protein
MKELSLLAVTVLGSITLAVSVHAQTPVSTLSEENASQLQPEEASIESNFEYDGDRLQNIESQLNQQVIDNNQNRPILIRLPDELGLPENLRLIESNGNYGVGTQLN